MTDRQAQVVIVLVFLAGLAWLTFQEPMLPDEDDCAARGQASDCWRSYEFSDPDVRSEPLP